MQRIGADAQLVQRPVSVATKVGDGTRLLPQIMGAAFGEHGVGARARNRLWVAGAACVQR